MSDNRPRLPRLRMSRRQFVAGAAGVAGAAALAGVLPETLGRVAAAAPPPGFDLSRIRHLVFLMQENRSFDHYFGTFPGARGFADPAAIRLPGGGPVFRQPAPGRPGGFLGPYHMSTISTGAAAVPSLNHSWRVQHEAWNHGAMDGFVSAHTASDGRAHGAFSMGYYTEADIPFHWALARAFTLCDNYFCSALGPTGTNRLFWEQGGNDPQGIAGGPVLESDGVLDLTYPTAPETLYSAGISYKWYGAGDWQLITSTASFRNFQSPGRVPAALFTRALPNGTLYGDGTPGGIGSPASPTPAASPDLAFEEDCANGVLPDVSFIGTNADEHPPHIPAAGARFLATKLEALAASEELWNSTVFILSYDENDGFFDHVPPPVPSVADYPEEFVYKTSPAGTPGGGLPLGAGFRVPAFVISPWTTGGRIFTGLTDHTSCLRLIEAVAAAGGLSGAGPVTFPNVSRWRRATFGDFSTALHPGAPRPAPASTQFRPAATAANLAAQSAAARLPQATPPGGA